MLQPIIIMFKRIAGIIRRINIDTLNLPCKVLLKRLQGKEVVTLDKHVCPPSQSPLTKGGLRGVSPFTVLNQYPRLQPRLILLANPCEFKFCYGFPISHVMSISQHHILPLAHQMPNAYLPTHKLHTYSWSDFPV